MHGQRYIIDTWIFTERRTDETGGQIRGYSSWLGENRVARPFHMFAHSDH